MFDKIADVINPSKNPDAKIRKKVSVLKEEELNQSHTPNSQFATGGIVTKLKAAEYMMNNGKSMFLCSGYDLSTAREFLLDGVHNSGTLFTRSKK